jgi:small-conductance mechanosensitive channel
LRGQSGKVTSIGVFFIRLQTPDDDLVSIPSDSLWTEVLVSANAGDRSSLCVMDFYLAPFATHQHRQEAEAAIWEAIQASPYCETSKPMQIYVTQLQDAIRLTARAYVASTYREAVFKNDVTRAFLETADSQRIPLASAEYRTDTSALTTTAGAAN